MSSPRDIAEQHGRDLASQLSSATEAAIVLEQHVATLLGYADLFAALQLSVASREMRRSLMHAITVLRVLQEELRCIGLIARLAGLKGPAC